METAKEYLTKLRGGFGGDTIRYACFIQLMKEFKDGLIDTHTVITKAAQLLKGNQNMINEFNQFLPQELRINIPPVEYDYAAMYVQRVKTEASAIYADFLNILKDYQNEESSIQTVYERIHKILSSYHNLLKDFYIFLPDAKDMAFKANNEEGIIVKKENENKNINNSEWEDFNPECMLLNLSPKARLPLPIVTRKGKLKAETETELGNDEICVDYEYKLMEAIFKAMISYHQSEERGIFAFDEFCKCLYLYMAGILSVTELLLLLEDFFPMDSGDLPYQLKRMIILRENSRRKYSYLCCSLGELDYSDCVKTGGNYQKLPENFPKLLCSGKDELCRNVLNDNWVSITSGSEDFSFKHMRKNQFEENLFKCEDERYELDMAIQCNLSTIKILKSINAKIEQLPVHERKNFKLTKAPFSIIHLKAISCIYGDHSDEILRHLIETPADSIPVILSCIQEKQQLWEKAMKNLTETVWKEIQIKNYYKSFDHRSFYFRQADKKMVSVKGFVNSIMEKYKEMRGCQTNFYECKKKKKSDYFLANNYEAFSQEEPDGNFQYVMTFDLSNFEVLRDAVELIFFAAARLASGPVLYARVSLFFEIFIRRFFFMDADVTTTELKGDNEKDKNNRGGNTKSYSGGNGLFSSFSKNVSNNCSPTGDELDVGVGVNEGGVTGSVLDAISDEEEENYGVEEEKEKEKIGIKKEKIVSACSSINKKKTNTFSAAGGVPNIDCKIAFKNFWDDVFNMRSSLINNGNVSDDVGSCNMKNEKKRKKDIEYIIANDSIYAILRFVCVVYDRLLMSKGIIEANKSNYNNGNNNITGNNFNNENNKIDNNYSVNENYKYKSYSFFYETCKAMASMQIDNNDFEDVCRNALGNNAYILFTAPSVLHAASKTIFHTINEYSSRRFLSMYIAYADTPFNKSAIEEYYGACSNFLSSRDFYAYKMDMHFNKKTLGIQVLSKKDILTINQDMMTCNIDNDNNINSSDKVLLPNEKMKPLKYATNSYFAQLAYGYNDSQCLSGSSSFNEGERKAENNELDSCAKNDSNKKKNEGNESVFVNKTYQYDKRRIKK